MSGVCHCREVLTYKTPANVFTVRSCSPSGGLDIGSAQVHLLLTMEAEQSDMHYRSQCYLSHELVTVRSSG